MRLRVILFNLIFLLTLCACREKKKVILTGEEPVNVADFIAYFTPFTLPHTISDSVFNSNLSDSLQISVPILKAIVSDTVYAKAFGKKSKPIFYALGKAEVPNAEKYIFIRAKFREQRFVWVLAFDHKNNFLAAHQFLKPTTQRATQQSLVMDRKYVLSQLQYRKNPDGTLSEGKEVYVLNAGASKFMLIMTEALEDKLTELINPIDTLPTVRKFSADYTNGKMNLVSIRDGRKLDRITFFIHFEKKEGSCIGELKGEALWKSSNRAEYQQAGDPCVLQFYFNSNSVRLQEQSCGSRRNAGCLFDGSFSRKKNSRVKKKG